MNKYLKIVLLSLLLALLILVRAFQTKLFYDPLIVYFKNDYLYTNIQDIDEFKLLVNMSFRYVINSILSLSLIWVLFENKEYLIFASYFLLIASIILFVVFGVLLKDNFKSGYLLTFYVRRFIIHPLFLLILLPAFYYQKRSIR